jgi:lysine-ketoglutarate reductase/saccharopine dehydrogenase-like protein (TIGR00300 family)
MQMNAIEENEVVLRKAVKDKTAPDDFYSTTNQPTSIYINGSWIPVKNQRMDCVIVFKNNLAYCRKLREIRKGDLVVCGEQGIKTEANPSYEEKEAFGFMSNTVSSERKVDLVVKRLAHLLHSRQKKVVVVAGPAVVHTGGDEYLRELIREGYISTLLCGNALAVHDIEKNLFGTSLGVCAKTGHPVKSGYRNHLRAINQVHKYNSIKGIVEAGVLTGGIMYECIKHNVPYVLAGSIRDDGPLPDTITDMCEAQDAYARAMEGADLVLVLCSMLHGIGVGNMLPTTVEMLCIDINPAAVTKLSDRGSSQAIGVVTDVGLFLNLLTKEINALSHLHSVKTAVL